MGMGMGMGMGMILYNGPPPRLKQEKKDYKWGAVGVSREREKGKKKVEKVLSVFCVLES